MKASPIKVGQVYVRLVVLNKTTPHITSGGNKVTRYSCRCSCGNVLPVKGTSLTTGNTRSCGCLHKECISKIMRKHGECKDGKGSKASPEYESWCHMIGRCCNKDNKDFHHYGGRGIKVCHKWRNSFSAFIKDMGRKPTKRHSLERIDNDGNYKPGNCRWATQREQCGNKRTCHKITIDGITKNLTEWASISGVHYTTIITRLKAGVSFKEAVFKPVRNWGNK